MDLALITAQQVFILFVLIFAGFVCGKTGILKIEYKKAMSDLLISLVVPAMIINSYIREFNKNDFDNLIKAFLLSVLIIGAGFILTIVFTWKMKSRDKSIFRIACVFSNAAYMGFPLIRALFGEEGILYASAYVTVYNILLWTAGYGIVSGEVRLKKVIGAIAKSPAIIAVVLGVIIYMARINIPAVISSPLKYIGDMNTPLSMIITGLTIAGSDMGKVVKNKNLPAAVALRMAVIPLVSFALLYFTGVKGMVPMVVGILEACPCAAITTMLAIQFGHNEDFAAGSVVITTFISIITLPLFALAGTIIM